MNGNGAVTVSDVQGDLEVSNRFGRTSAARIGKKCTVTSSNGDVSLDGAGSASVEASFGKLDVRNVSGELSARNSNGAVTAAGVGGKADLATSFGTISFTDMKAAVDARGSNSAVNGRKTGGGVMVRTTFGGVELADVGGPASRPSPAPGEVPPALTNAQYDEDAQDHAAADESPIEGMRFLDREVNELLSDLEG